MDILKFARKKKDGLGNRILIASLVILMFIIFLIGLHIGRIVEKSAEMSYRARVVAKPSDIREEGRKIEEKLNQFQGKEATPGTRSELRVGETREGEEVGSGASVFERDETKRAEESRHGQRATRNRVSERSTAGGASVSEKMGGYYLQVGVFAVKSNALAMEKRAKSFGLGVRLEKMRDKRGRKLTRVLVGPYPTRETASRNRVEVARKLGVTSPVIVKR